MDFLRTTSSEVEVSDCSFRLCLRPAVGVKFRCDRATQHRDASVYSHFASELVSPHKAHSGMWSHGRVVGTGGDATAVVASAGATSFS